MPLVLIFHSLSSFPLFDKSNRIPKESMGGGKRPLSPDQFMAFWMQLESVRPKWLGWANRVELQLPIMGKVK